MADEFWYLWYEYRGFRIFVAVLVLGLIALLVWLFAIRSTGSEATAPVEPGGGPAAVTQENLVALSEQVHEPIYWAGTMPGTRLELTETNNSYAYIRYLTSDAAIGDPSPDFLTVGTYPSLNAYSNLRAYAQHNHASTTRIRNGGLAVRIPGSPTSVYFAYPHQDVQVEVYDPDPQRALNLVKSGVVRPVLENPTAAAPTAIPPTTTTTAVPTAIPTTTTTTTTTGTPAPTAPPANPPGG